MNIKKNFLFELGTEELPPKILKNLAQTLLSNVENQLKQVNIKFGSTKWFASPRRLAFIINGLAQLQDDIVIERQGPLMDIAYKDRQPTKVGLGFAKSCGVDFDQLEKINTSKGEKLFYKTIQKGKKSINLLQDIVANALKQLPIPKMMCWGNSDIEFVRPVHWVLSLYDNDIVNMKILGHEASNVTYGHRFHNPEAIIVNSSNDYVDILDRAMVIVDWSQRRQMIVEESKKIAKQNNYHVVLNDNLVDEVCAIVEYPNAMLCSFNKDFLRVPQEALVSSIEKHQKCFALLNDKGKLAANFITISNIKSTKPELVSTGNQKVMDARLADAAFFYDTDVKESLDSLVPKLKNVIFQNKLGNMYQKSQRIANSAKELAKFNNEDPQTAYRAGLLAKADLVSNMVVEFADLQGIVGKYYAKICGESDIIADAIEQQYWPQYSGAELPKTNVANYLALADKLDTLVGIFGIDQKPTGSKDPFALRRFAIGILRILRDADLDISLDKIIDIALSSYKLINNIEFKVDIKKEIITFFLDRFKNLYKDEEVSVNIFESINNSDYKSIKDFGIRVKAVVDFVHFQQAKNIIALNKRVSNILSKNSKDIILDYNINLAKITGSKYELELAKQIVKVGNRVKTLASNRKYSQALKLLVTLDKTISDFFDNVMVADEDLNIRSNRMALLANLNLLFTGVADVSKL